MLTLWNPLNRVSLYDRLFDSSWEREFSPAIDIYEDEEAVHLTAELPGLSPEDIKINVKNNVLSISGERKIEKEDKKGEYHRVERSYGSFYRSFSLPKTVDSENVEASYKNGVLNLKLTKKPEEKPREIKILSN